jgi:hypothetical protein
MSGHTGPRGKRDNHSTIEKENRFIQLVRNNGKYDSDSPIPKSSMSVLTETSKLYQLDLGLLSPEKHSLTSRQHLQIVRGFRAGLTRDQLKAEFPGVRSNRFSVAYAYYNLVRRTQLLGVDALERILEQELDENPEIKQSAEDNRSKSSVPIHRESCMDVVPNTSGTHKIRLNASDFRKDVKCIYGNESRTPGKGPLSSHHLDPVENKGEDAYPNGLRLPKQIHEWADSAALIPNPNGSDPVWNINPDLLALDGKSIGYTEEDLVLVGPEIRANMQKGNDFREREKYLDKRSKKR